MNKRDPMIHCPERHDIIQMMPTRNGGVQAVRHFTIHDWRQRLDFNEIARHKGLMPDGYYCTNCLSLMLDALDDEGKPVQQLSYSDQDFDPEAEAEAATVPRLVVPG